MSNTFWVKDISVLVEPEKIFQVLPLYSMTLEEKLLISLFFYKFNAYYLLNLCFYKKRKIFR